MERGDTDRHSARGGEVVPSLPDLRPRLTRALPAFAALAALAAYPPAAAERAGGLLALAAIVAAAVLVVALVWRLGVLVQLPLGLAGAEFAVLLYDGGAGIVATALFAGGLVLAAELAYWSVELPAARGSAVVARRAATIILTGAGAGALAWFLIAATDVTLRGSLVLEAIGIAAAVIAVGFVVRLAAISRTR